MQRTFKFIICMLIIGCVGAEDANLQELTDTQMESLLSFCNRTDNFHTLTVKPSWTPFNEDAEQCRARVLERKYHRIYLKINSFGSHKVHTNLLFGCNGSDDIHSLNLVSMKSNTVNDSTCPGKAYAVIYINGRDYESMEVTGKKFSSSYYNKSAGVLDMKTLQAIEKTCYSHPQVVPSTPQEMRQKLYNWVGCVNHAVDLNVGELSEIYPGCDLALDARISQSHLTMDFAVFLSLNEIKRVTAHVLQRLEEWLISANQSTCINKEPASTTFEQMSSENLESNTGDMEWVPIIAPTHPTTMCEGQYCNPAKFSKPLLISITIVVLVCVVAVAYLAILYKRRHCVTLRNNSSAEEQSLRQFLTANAENLEDGSTMS